MLLRLLNSRAPNDERRSRAPAEAPRYVVAGAEHRGARERRLAATSRCVDDHGQPVAGVAVYAVPADAGASATAATPQDSPTATMDQAHNAFVPHVLDRASRHVRAVPQQRRREPSRLLVLRCEDLRVPSLQGQRASAAVVRETRARRARLQHSRRHARLHSRRRHAALRRHGPQRRARARVAARRRLRVARLDSASEARRSPRRSDGDDRHGRTTSPGSTGSKASSCPTTTKAARVSRGNGTESRRARGRGGGARPRRVRGRRERPPSVAGRNRRRLRRGRQRPRTRGRKAASASYATPSRTTA